jgi:hypothetical protein
MKKDRSAFAFPTTRIANGCGALLGADEATVRVADVGRQFGDLKRAPAEADVLQGIAKALGA